MMRRALVALALGGAAVWVGVFAPFSLLGTANLALRYALVAISLVILTGWVGQISLAQAAFVGLGAFATGVAIRTFDLDFPLTIVVGAALGAVSAAALGVVALRVRGLFLAVATLIFAWAAQAYLFNLPWLAGAGGSSIAPTRPLGDQGTVPYMDFGDRRTFYVLLVTVVAGVLLGAANLRDSKTGRAWFAVKGSEIAAASLGIDVTRTKMGAFALSGGVAGLSGALLMTHAGVASSTQFSVQESLFFLAIAVVGGLTSLPGAVAGGVLFASLEELSFRFDVFAGMLLVVSATLLAVVLLFFPAGLAGIPARLAHAGRAIRQARMPVVVRRVAAAGRRLLARHPAPDETATSAHGEGLDHAAPPPPPPPPLEVDAAPSPSEVGEIDDVEEIGGRPSVLRRLVARLTGPTRRRDRRRLRRAEAPDALGAAVVTAALVETSAVPAGLAYRPGVATKVGLPPRPLRPPVLVAHGVTVRFGGLTAVNDFTLEVRQGEIVGLIGPNGAGKTTLFNAVSGLNQPTAGTVELYGQDVSRLAVHQRARLGMGRTFQVIQLFPDRSVFDNLMVATHQRNPTGFFANLAATRTAIGWEVATRDRVRQVIELVGLEEVADRQVAGLPFGVLRLVELARALVTGAPLVMLDEPASGLDNTETDAFMDLLLWVRQYLDITMLLIEHDMRVAMGLSDHLYVIDRGTKIAEGTPTEVQRDPAVIAAYLGSAEEVGDAVEAPRPRAAVGSGRR